MAEMLHTPPAGVGSSASSPSHSQEQLRYEDADISGAYLGDTHHNGEIYLAMQYYSQEAQNSSQVLRPISIASEECDGGPPDDPIEAHKGMRLIPRGWSLEIAGLFLTLAAFISLLVVLKRVDKQPLSTWHFPFSVNTVISTLSIIMKTPLAFAIGSCLGQGKWSWFTKRSGPLSGFVTFDDASRGPLGCVALLWWLKSRHWASLGAWVTLLLLGVDPFWQAVIQYGGKLVLIEHNNSSLLTSRQLSIGDWYTDDVVTLDYHGHDDVYQASRLYPDVGMTATFLIAAINSSSSDLTQPPGISCRTGNCTWPLYTTLGICNTCFDVTDQVVRERGFGMPDENVFSSCHDTSFTVNYTYTSYVIPYPNKRRAVLQNLEGYIQQSDCKLRSRVGLSPVFQPTDTYQSKESKTLLASFALLELSSDYWDNLTTFEQATPKATECALEFCALAYETQMRDGIPRESLTSMSKARVENSYSPAGNLSPDTLGFIQRDFGYSLTESASLLLSSSSPGSLTLLIPRHDLQVALSQDEDFNSSPRVFNITQKSIATMIDDLSKNTTLDSITFGISNTTNITQTFDNIAHLLTYRMREVDGTTALGFSEQWIVFTHVRWEFIIFPVIILISGYIFTIGAILDSQRLDLRTMKSDTIATLLWGLDDGTRQYLRYEKQQHDRDSDKIVVKLSTEVDGLQLRAL